MTLLPVFTTEDCSQKVYTDYVNEDVWCSQMIGITCRKCPEMTPPDLS
jgi:hypothetical protein